MRTQLRSIWAAVALGVPALGGCDKLDVTDLNNPGLDQLEQNPTPSAVNTAASGLLIGLRNGVSAENGWVTIVGAMGREGYNLNTVSDPRYISEVVVGPLSPGSPAFGANFWPQRYANIRNATVLLNAVDNVVGLSDAEKEGIRGFTKTIQALEFLSVIVSRDENGAVIDVNRPPTGEPGPIAPPEEVYAKIVELLEEGRTHLQAAGGAFSFRLSTGFGSFDTPLQFLKVNRAIRARVAVYLDDWNTALDALLQSFLDTNAPLSTGVYHVFGTGSGDLTNLIIQSHPFIRAEPSLLTSAQLQPNNQPDLRATTKIATGDPATGGTTPITVTSDKIFTLYPDPTSPVAIIRNEELVLLRAEANVGLGTGASIAAALDDINLIRTNAGGLAPYSGAQTAAAVLDELLYNKRYSLLWEGGHSWIDFRHYNKLTALPRQAGENGKFFTKMPFPNNECLARTDAASLPGCSPVVGQ